MSSISKHTYKILSKLTKDTAIEYVQQRHRSSAHPSERYKKYCHAKTVGEALELGSLVEDFLGDLEHKLLKVAGNDRRMKGFPVKKGKVKNGTVGSVGFEGDADFNGFLLSKPDVVRTLLDRKIPTPARNVPRSREPGAKHLETQLHAPVVYDPLAPILNSLEDYEKCVKMGAESGVKRRNGWEATKRCKDEHEKISRKPNKRMNFKTREQDEQKHEKMFKRTNQRMNFKTREPPGGPSKDLDMDDSLHCSGLLFRPTEDEQTCQNDLCPSPHSNAPPPMNRLHLSAASPPLQPHLPGGTTKRRKTNLTDRKDSTDEKTSKRTTMRIAFEEELIKDTLKGSGRDEACLGLGSFLRSARDDRKSEVQEGEMDLLKKLIEDAKKLIEIKSERVARSRVWKSLQRGVDDAKKKLEKDGTMKKQNKRTIRGSVKVAHRQSETMAIATKTKVKANCK